MGSTPRESEAKRSLIVPAVTPSNPLASPESMISQWERLNAGELPSDVMEVDAPDLGSLNGPTETAEGLVTGSEQSVLHDTLPSPPPSPDEVA